ncbi:MAG: hypothetical protein K0S33_3711 [Bacteroidetes bacterium]|jgi:hypothetical protein|nr:hypothetical protein [Bacteroidota bacterium]
MGKERVIQLPSSRPEWMAFIHRYLSNGMRIVKSTAPKEWMAKKGLSAELTGAGFNSGQIHHRRDQSFKDALAEIGFMKRTDVPVNCDTVPYTVFGIFSIMFPLRNQKEEIVNFYSVRIKSDNAAYMNEEPGLYPGYPHELTKRLFVVNSVLDAATVLQAKALDNKEAVIALHDGKFMPEHEEAIQSLKHLKEIVYIDSPLMKVQKEKTVWGEE